MNKYLFLIKNHLKYKQSSILIILLVSFSVLSIVTSLNIVKTNEQIMLDEMFDTFGSYTISIEDVNALEKKEMLKSDTKVKDVFPIFVESFDLENQSYSLYYSDSDIFNHLGVELIAGQYPTGKNEIAVERSYLFSHGIPMEDMIGSKINIPIDDGGHKKEYTVSCIIQFNKSNSNSENEVGFLFFNECDSYNRLLLQVDSIENYEKSLDYITEKYSIDRDKCYVNFDLFTVLGITTGENVLKANTYYYMFIFIIIMFCTIIILYNIIKVFLKNISTDIAVNNLIGIPKNLTIQSFLLYLFTLITIGIILGCLLGFTVVIPFINLFLTKAVSFQNIIQNFRFDLLIISLVLYFMLTFILAIPTIINLKNISAMSLLRNGLSASGNISKRYTHLFGFKKTLWKMKIALRNINMHKFSVFFNILAIGFSISVLVVGMFFIEINLQAFGYNNNFNYKLEFDPNGDYEKQSSFFNEISNQDDFDIFPEYVKDMQINIPKECLNPKYINYLSKDANDDLNFNYTLGKNVNLDIIVLGYNQEQVNDLCRVNGIEQIALDENEAILLNKTIPLRGHEGFDLNIAIGAKIKFNTHIPEGVNSEHFYIKEKVDKLSVYPTGIYNKPCIIINTDLFKKLTEISTPNIVYLNVGKNSSDIIEQKILGNDFYTLTVPSEQEAYIINSNQILSRIVILFFVIIILTVGISLFSSLYIRIYLLQTEYVSYKCLGISFFDLAKIIGIEILFMFTFGSLLAFLFSAGSTFYMQNILLEDIGKYLYSFPIKLFIAALVVSFSIICVCFIFIAKGIYKINVIKYLKNIT